MNTINEESVPAGHTSTPRSWFIWALALCGPFVWHSVMFTILGSARSDCSWFELSNEILPASGKHLVKQCKVVRERKKKNGRREDRTEMDTQGFGFRMLATYCHESLVLAEALTGLCSRRTCLIVLYSY